MATSSKKSTKKAKVTTPTVHVTMGLFDTRDPIYRVAREAVPIAEFKPLTAADYHPSGGTPLRDATARFIGHLDGLRQPDRVTIGLLFDESGSMGGNQMSVIEGANQFVDGMRAVDAVSPDAAGKVLAVIVTDGEENSSREVTPEILQGLVAEREADGFTFIFLGANIDAWDVGASLGYSGGVTGQAVNFRSTPQGTAAAMGSITSDAQGYLSSPAAYATTRSSSSLRSIAEDGTETTANTGATTPPDVSPQPWAPPTPPPSPDYTSDAVADALRKAKEATE